jgi:hypothetical protein
MQKFQDSTIKVQQNNKIKFAQYHPKQDSTIKVFQELETAIDSSVLG